jgi:hypothetical protein
MRSIVNGKGKLVRVEYEEFGCHTICRLHKPWFLEN